MQKDEQCLALFERMFVTTDVDDNVELKMDVQKAARKCLKKF